MAALATTIAPKVRGGGFYITGLEAATARLTNKAVSVQRDSVKATDAAAKVIEQAQRSSGTFADRTRDTRSSITNEASWEGGDYSRRIGPTHFVARYLVFGTVNMSRKWDLFGASQPGIESWMSEMSKIAGDL